MRWGITLWMPMGGRNPSLPRVGQMTDRPSHEQGGRTFRREINANYGRGGYSAIRTGPFAWCLNVWFNDRHPNPDGVFESEVSATYWTAWGAVRAARRRLGGTRN